MTDARRKAFEAWLDAPDQNYKDQASIYWSAFAAGCKFMQSRLESDEVVDRLVDGLQLIASPALGREAKQYQAKKLLTELGKDTHD